MTAKEYLSQAASLDREISRKIDRLGDLEALITKTTSVLSAMPGGRNDERTFENRMEKYLLLRDEINADIDRLIDLKQEIHSVIDRLDSEDERMVLEEHFLKGKKYEEIAGQLHYNWNTVSKICSRGLKKIKIPENGITGDNRG